MRIIASWTIPNMRIVSEGNSNENFWKKSARRKIQKTNTKVYFLRENPDIRLPCSIRLTRIAPRMLDSHDNLPMSLKWIVDSLADCIFPGKAAGRADDCKEITWLYNQEKGKTKEYALRVEIMRDD